MPDHENDPRRDPLQEDEPEVNPGEDNDLDNDINEENEPDNDSANDSSQENEPGDDPDDDDLISKAAGLWNRMPVYAQLILGIIAAIVVMEGAWLMFGVSPFASFSLVAVGFICSLMYKHYKKQRARELQMREDARNRYKGNSSPRTPNRSRSQNDHSGHNKSLIEEVDPDKLRGFKDVAGCEFVITELQEIIDYLKDPSSFEDIGARVPKGVLLEGDPGTGKTLLAEAMAKECGVPFFKVSGSEFVELYVGTGAARVRDMFATARAKSPSILFIDEIDAVGGKRGRSVNSHEEREQTLNQMLVEMDGLDADTSVIVIAATNRYDMLDDALTRAGRFDRHVTVPRPDLDARIKILKVHAKSKRFANNVNFEDVAELVPGFVGADLENLLNEAALLARREKNKKISMGNIEDAVQRVVAGSKRDTMVLSDEALKTVAYHEGGHTLVGLLHEHADSPQSVTIIPRTKGSLGHTFTAPADKYLHNKQELIARIAVLYGGRVAEDLKLDIETSGSGNDIEKASEIARAMVMDLGMGSHQKLKGRSFAHTEEGTRAFQLSEEMKQLIDAEIGSILEQGEEEARQILKENSELLEMLKEELLEVETMNKKDLERLLNEYFSKNSKESRSFWPAREKK